MEAGAVRVLKDSGRSRLAVGVMSVKGKCTRGEVISCVDEEGSEVARGLVNYGSDEIEKIRGRSSENIDQLLGYAGEAEIVHRDNLILND